eukprot:4818600-Pleurochrysis_carterae.AAC.2
MSSLPCHAAPPLKIFGCDVVQFADVLSYTEAEVEADADVPAAVVKKLYEAFAKSKGAQRTEAECNADSPSLRIIRDKYGEMGERLLHTLLTLDALFDFRKVMRRRLFRRKRARTPCSSFRADT